MVRLSHLILALLLIVSLGVVVGCGDDADEAEETETTEETATTEEIETTEADTEDETTEDVSGAQVFAEVCATCHGPDGTGGVGPDLTQLSLSQEEVANQVRNGGGGMPAYGDELSDEEIDAVAGHVVDEFME